MPRSIAKFWTLFAPGAGGCITAPGLGFWPNWSLGALRYRMDRTHSIMRIATTASPVSGSEVRGQMYQLAMLKEWRISCNAMARITRNWQQKQMMRQHMRAMRGPSIDARPMAAALGFGGLFGSGGDDDDSQNQTADAQDVFVDSGKSGIAIMADAESFRKPNGEDKACGCGA